VRLFIVSYGKKLILVISDRWELKKLIAIYLQYYYILTADGRRILGKETLNLMIHMSNNHEAKRCLGKSSPGYRQRN